MEKSTTNMGVGGGEEGKSYGSRVYQAAGNDPSVQISSSVIRRKGE